MSFDLGIIGAGSVASLHAAAAVAAGIRLAAVCDIDGDRAGALAERYGATATTGVQALLSRREIAGVVVAVPNVLHRPMAIAALRAGKHVLLEKPMALNAAECDEIIAVAGKAGRAVQIGFVCRCAPAARAAATLLAEGKLGRIYHARASVHRRRGIPGLGRWFTTRAQSGGGVLMDLGVHLIDLLLHLTGFPRPRRASAALSSTFGDPPGRYRFEGEMWAGPPDPHGVFDVEDGAACLIRFDGGLAMELSTAWAANLPADLPRDGFLFLGEAGSGWLDLWKNELIVTVEQGGRLVETRPPLEDDPWTSAWREQARRFANTVTRGAAPAATADEGRQVQRLIDALYRSSAEGREVEV